MKAEVTKRGLLIPKELLAGADEVEIRKVKHQIVITPLPKPDPISELGKNPVKCGLPDAAEKHDRYLNRNE